MQYWGHMHDKNGFDDGEAIPAGAEEHRTVYIRYLNARLQRFESNVRVIAFNRPGVHNYLLIRCAPAHVIEGLTAVQIEGGDFALTRFDQEEVDFDDAYFVAVEDAMEADLDRFVEVKTAISSDFEQALQEALA